MDPTGIDRILLVASGKGGVGKSTVAVNLAVSLVNAGLRVGLLDADAYGPSVAIMLGAAEPPALGAGEAIPPLVRHGVRVMSLGYLVDPEAPVIWRGPRLAGAVLQLFAEVAWGDLDILIIDLPPGTGDVQLSIAQQIEVTGAVVVTTPQTVALADVVRAKHMFDKVGIPTLGVIENMSWFACPSCGDRHAIFAAGGGGRLADELGLELLGELPLDPQLRAAGDSGQPLVDFAPESDSARRFAELAARVNQATLDAGATRGDRVKRKRHLQIIQ